MRLYASLLSVVLLVGCLQPAEVAPKPQPPTPTPTALSDFIADVLKKERLANADTARRVAVVSTSAERKLLWESNHSVTALKAAGDISSEIKSKLDAAKTADEVSTIWKEVAAGYAK